MDRRYAGHPMAEPPNIRADKTVSSVSPARLIKVESTSSRGISNLDKYCSGSHLCVSRTVC